MKEKVKFDMEAAIKALCEGKDLSGQNDRGRPPPAPVTNY